MRVFLDTNVLASAAATRGLCADVLREVLTSHGRMGTGLAITYCRNARRDPVNAVVEELKRKGYGRYTVR